MSGLGAFGPVASTAAPVLGSVWQTTEQEKEAQANREFQQGQAATAVQTRAADMKAAGINPILAAGSPAQAMSGSMPAMGGNPGEAGVSGFASAQQARREIAATRQLEEQAEKTSAEKENVDADTFLKTLQPDLIRAQTQASLASAGQAEQQADKLKYQIKELLPVEKWQRINAAGLSFAETLRQQTESALNKAELERVMPLMVRYHALQNRALELSMPGREAQAAHDTNFPYSPYLEDVGRVVSTARDAAIGGAAGAAALGSGLRVRGGSGRRIGF